MTAGAFSSSSSSSGDDMPPCSSTTAAAASAPAAPPLPPACAVRAAALTARALVGALAGTAFLALCALVLLRAAPLPLLAAVWAGLECAFFAWQRGHAARLDAIPQDHRPDKHDGPETLARYMAARRHFPFSWEFLHGWFRCVPACFGLA